MLKRFNDLHRILWTLSLWICFVVTSQSLDFKKREIRVKMALIGDKQEIEKHRKWSLENYLRMRINIVWTETTGLCDDNGIQRCCTEYKVAILMITIMTAMMTAVLIHKL